MSALIRSCPRQLVQASMHLSIVKLIRENALPYTFWPASYIFRSIPTLSEQPEVCLQLKKHLLVIVVLFRSLFAFCVIELPGGYPKFFKPLLLAHIILVAVCNHLSDVFLCHHRWSLFNRRLLSGAYIKNYLCKQLQHCCWNHRTIVVESTEVLLPKTLHSKLLKSLHFKLPLTISHKLPLKHTTVSEVLGCRWASRGLPGSMALIMRWLWLSGELRRSRFFRRSRGSLVWGR